MQFTAQLNVERYAPIKNYWKSIMKIRKSVTTKESAKLRVAQQSYQGITKKIFVNHVNKNALLKDLFLGDGMRKS